MKLVLPSYELNGPRNINWREVSPVRNLVLITTAMDEVQDELLEQFSSLWQSDEIGRLTVLHN